MNLFVWLIKVSVALGVVSMVTVVAIDVITGTSMVQSMADLLATGGYTVSVFSPAGAPEITPNIFQAPEIDVASGKCAIALLAGVLLLVGERFRSRHY